MGIKELKEMCCQANLELARKGLVVYTWGNVSQLDREKGIFVIKPSGVPYEELTGEMMVAVDVETGRALEDRYKPSSDTPTHVELYRAFEGIGGVTHTHSPAATAWAQACRGIPCLGTTHADYFHGDVPVTRHLTKEEVEQAYEKTVFKCGKLEWKYCNGILRDWDKKGLHTPEEIAAGDKLPRKEEKYRKQPAQTAAADTVQDSVAWMKEYLSKTGGK